MEESQPLVVYYDANPKEIIAVRAGLPQASVVPMAMPLHDGSLFPAEAAVADVLSIGLASRVE